MKIIFIILLSVLFSGKDSSKFDIDFGNLKNLNLDLMNVNNLDKIKSQKYLMPYEIEALQKQASDYIPTAVGDSDIVIIETSRGTMKLRLLNDIAPNHCYNFKKLANSGFYDETYFHRIIKNFMIQGGDILTRDKDYTNDGRGGPDWTIDNEFNNIKHKKGILSMARSSDVNSAGSQFFICSADAPHLDGQYTAFGEVIDGEHVIGKLNNTETHRTVILRSSKQKIPDGENFDNWIQVTDYRSRKVLYSKIPEDYSAESYTSYLKNELNNDKPIRSPKIIKIRVVDSIED